MNGRDLPRARQGARRLELDQRDDLPARQPARLRALGGRPRHGVVGLRALPAVLQAHGDVPGRRRRVPRRRRAAALERGPATNPLFGAFFEAAQQAGYTLTDDVNGYRQEGFAPFDRNIRRGRRLSAARAYLHPVMKRPNLEVQTRAQVTRVLSRDARRRREYRAGKGPLEQARAAEVILCGGAINSPQVLELSGVGDATALARRSASTSCTTCPASARTCRTTSRSTSSTRASSRSRSRPRCSTRNRPGVVPEVAALPQRPGRHEPLRGRRLRPLQRRRRSTRT